LYGIVEQYETRSNNKITVQQSKIKYNGNTEQYLIHNVHFIDNINNANNVNDIFNDISSIDFIFKIYISSLANFVILLFSISFVNPSTRCSFVS